MEPLLAEFQNEIASRKFNVVWVAIINKIEEARKLVTQELKFYNIVRNQYGKVNTRLRKQVYMFILSQFITAIQRVIDLEVLLIYLYQNSDYNPNYDEQILLPVQQDILALEYDMAILQQQQNGLK